MLQFEGRSRTQTPYFVVHELGGTKCCGEEEEGARHRDYDKRSHQTAFVNVRYSILRGHVRLNPSEEGLVLVEALAAPKREPVAREGEKHLRDEEEQERERHHCRATHRTSVRRVQFAGGRKS